MPDIKKPVPSVEEYYDGLYGLDGAVLDKDSYEKHVNHTLFEQPQDLRQIAADAIHAERQAEYRPETAAFLAQQPETGEYIQTYEAYVPTEMRITLNAPYIIRQGSGSYLSSGSYRLSSGSYYISSGSYRFSFGSSYRMSSSLGGYGLNLI